MQENVKTDGRIEEQERLRLQQPALKLQGVGTSFFHFGEGRFVLKDISFTLERGYMLGLIEIGRASCRERV